MFYKSILQFQVNTLTPTMKKNMWTNENTSFDRLITLSTASGNSYNQSLILKYSLPYPLTKNSYSFWIIVNKNKDFLARNYLKNTNVSNVQTLAKVKI